MSELKTGDRVLTPEGEGTVLSVVSHQVCNNPEREKEVAEFRERAGIPDMSEVTVQVTVLLDRMSDRRYYPGYSGTTFGKQAVRLRRR